MSLSSQSSSSSNAMIILKNERVLLVRRPNGLPRPHDFRTELVDMPVKASWFAPPQQQDQTTTNDKCDLILETLFVSIDPAMRGWMSAAKSYLPPIQLGSVVRASTISRIVAASSGLLEETYPLGCIVRTEVVGVQSYGMLKDCTPRKARKLLTRLDYNKTSGGIHAPLVPNTRLSYASFLGVLGTTGLTAYFGFLRVGQPKSSDVVLVSGAAGATGSMVAQIAKHVTKCQLVIGTAGSDKKCDWLLRNKIVDVAINYKTCKSLSKAISQACRKHHCQGVDLVFDNVGSTFLEAALSNLAMGAKIVLCGAISQYNAPSSNSANAIAGPRNYMNLLVKRATMTGFVVLDYKQEFQQAIGQLMQWIAEGKIRCYQEDMTHAGISNFYPALMSLFEGTNVGKVVLRVQTGDDEASNSKSSSSSRHRSKL